MDFLGLADYTNHQLFRDLIWYFFGSVYRYFLKRSNRFPVEIISNRGFFSFAVFFFKSMLKTILFLLTVAILEYS